ncbi:MAG: hypothetical protein KGJ13_06250 [Patescibacteria group bacterium]|nr:hypothetical protein [Patescibacteria group bacterium]
MNTVEKMLRAVFSAMDLDVETVKSDVLERVAAFERNVETLNNTLIAHHRSLAGIETTLARIESHLGISQPTAKPQTETVNGITQGTTGADFGRTLPPPTE